jgi:hypothetical protein
MKREGKMLRNRYVRPLILVAALLLVCLANHPAQALDGPFWPPPGGTTLSTSGTSMGTGSGYTFTFTKFNPGYYSTLEWGPWDSNSIHLSMDGTVDTAGETITLTHFGSNGNSGYAYGYGTTTIDTVFGSKAVDTYFQVVITDLSGGGNGGVPYDSANGLFNVTSAIASTGGFQATLWAEASDHNSNSWYSFDTYYNINHTPYLAQNQAISDFSGGFWYDAPTAVPEPATVLFLALSLFGAGAVGRKFKK